MLGVHSTEVHNVERKCVGLHIIGVQCGGAKYGAQDECNPKLLQNRDILFKDAVRMVCTSSMEHTELTRQFLVSRIY